MTENHWAELRQVGLATLDHEAAVRAATELLELGPGFGDPLLADWHLGADRSRHLPGDPRPDHARPLDRQVAGPDGRRVRLGTVGPGAVPGRSDRTRR